MALPGGRSLTIRGVRRSDAGDLVALYAGLDQDDLYRRFFTAHAPPDKFVGEMTRVAGRGGVGLVAVIEEPGRPGRLVAEASYELLPDGDGELGITVAEESRGWLGPFLLDALVEEAAERGVPSIQADVLVANRPMLALLRARGYAVVGRDDRPASVRVSIGVARHTPTWPGPHDRPRLLVEVPGGRWHAEDAAREAGFQVVVCPGPQRGWSHCPALRGEPCPLAAGADVIVDAVPGGQGRSLLDAHRRLHPSVPVCVEMPPGTTTVAQGPSGARASVVVGLVQRLAKGGGADGGRARPPG